MVPIWVIYIMYKIEGTLTYIFADDGRRYHGDYDRL